MVLATRNTGSFPETGRPLSPKCSGTPVSVRVDLVRPGCHKFNFSRRAPITLCFYFDHEPRIM